PQQHTSEETLFDRNPASFLACSMVGNLGRTFTSDGQSVSGNASGDMKNLFAGILGPRTMTVSVTSAAKNTQVSICALGLNGLANGSFDINGQPQFNAACAVQASTTGSAGMSREGKALVKAQDFA